MKQFTILFLFLFLKGFAQNTTDQKVFKVVMKNDWEEKKVISQNSTGHKTIIDLISKKIIYNSHFPAEKITLTDIEVKNVIAEIKKNDTYKFKPKTFPFSTLISPDTLKSYSANKYAIWNKERIEVLQSQDSTRMVKFNREKGYPYNVVWVTFLSKPIYLRNNSISIVYYAKLCDFDRGMGGCYSVIILKRTQGIWKKYIEIPIGCY